MSLPHVPDAAVKVSSNSENRGLSSPIAQSHLSTASLDMRDSSLPNQPIEFAPAAPQNLESSSAIALASSNVIGNAVSAVDDSVFHHPETAIRMISDAATVKMELAVATDELDRKSAQLEALSQLVSYLKLHSTLFSSASLSAPLATAVSPSNQSFPSIVDVLREALSTRTAEVAFWRQSHEQMATALVFAEEELKMQTASKAQLEDRLRASSAASAIALAAAENRFSALQEQAGDLIAQTEELSHIISLKNDELRAASLSHSEYVQSTTALLEQQELALAELQRHTSDFSNIQRPSSIDNSLFSNQGNGSDTSHPSDVGLIQSLRLQVQELEEQLLLQPRVTRPNLNPSYQPSSSTSPATRVSTSDYVPPPLPPSELLDEVGFSFANSSMMISLASSDPSSLVATVSASLDELGRVHDAAWTRVSDSDIEILEGRLDSMIAKFRRVKLLRLQLQKQELEDTKRCRLCQDNDIEVVLLPCGHHCLCRGCASNLVICPLCRATIENRVRTFGS